MKPTAQEGFLLSSQKKCQLPNELRLSVVLDVDHLLCCLFCNVIQLWRPASVPYCSCGILQAWRPAAVASCKRGVLQLWHPASVVSYSCGVLQLWHPAAVASCKRGVLQLARPASVASCSGSLPSSALKMFFLVTAFLLSSSAFATSELSDAEARSLLKLTLTASSRAGNASSTATKTIYIEDPHDPPYYSSPSTQHQHSTPTSLPSTLYRETVLSSKRHPYTQPDSYSDNGPYNAPDPYGAPNPFSKLKPFQPPNHLYQYNSDQNTYKSDASETHNSGYSSLPSALSDLPWGVPLDYRPEVLVPSREIHPYTDMKPGFCPPLRPRCPDAESRIRRPRLCSSDTHCETADKCCYDQCLLRYACKPPSGPQYTFRK
ncbi:WAP-type 'four-disulfide core' domain [Trinorchestia longiramus]|nr:WAP-type 'four-disulfide core' domain [Trinorchestia longiramus]